MIILRTISNSRFFFCDLHFDRLCGVKPRGKGAALFKMIKFSVSPYRSFIISDVHFYQQIVCSGRLNYRARSAFWLKGSKSDETAIFLDFWQTWLWNLVSQLSSRCTAIPYQETDMFASEENSFIIWDHQNKNSLVICISIILLHLIPIITGTKIENGVIINYI